MDEAKEISSRFYPEDAYLLERLCYIHLHPVNFTSGTLFRGVDPIRASLVETLGELGRYPFTGRSVLMGRLLNRAQ